jgi:hypothetical protein
VIIQMPNGGVGAFTLEGGYRADKTDSDLDLFLNCPDKTRIVTAEELPLICWVRWPHHGPKEFLVISRDSSDNSIEIPGFHLSLKHLARHGGEYRGVGKDWSKFEVVIP